TASVQDGSAAVQAGYRQAAAVDAAVAPRLAASDRRRIETFTTVVEMIPRRHLRRPHRESAETAWAIASPEVFLLLRNQHGWDAARYRRWLGATLVEVLLIDAS